MNRSRLRCRFLFRASSRLSVCLFLLQIAIFSASANLLWSPINGPTYPQMTAPGKVLLTWQLPGPNLIQNGSFEEPPTNSWTVETSERMSWRWLTTPVNSTNRALVFNALASSQAAQSASISQVVTIPEASSSAILSWRVPRTSAFNTLSLRLEVRSLDDQILASQPASGDSFITEIHSADLSNFSGQTVRIVFRAIGTSGNTIALDEIRLTVSPVEGAEFDVYLGPTSNLNTTHLLGRTSALRWDITDRVIRGVNHWRVDVRSRGQVARGTAWSFSHSTQPSGSASELLLRNPIPAPAVNESISVEALLTDLRGISFAQKPIGGAVLDAGLVANGLRPATIAITELYFGTTNTIEFMNVSSNEVDISGWKIVVYVSNTASGVFTNTLPAETKVPAGEIFLLLPGSPAPGTYPLLRTGRTSVQSAPQAVALLDATGKTIDFVHVGLRLFSNQPDPELWVRPGQSVENWIGESVIGPEANRSVLRVGGSDRNDRLDWVSGTNSIGTVNSGLVHPFSLGAGVLNGSHRTFTNTISTAWTGSLSSTEPATNAFLVARYLTFHARQGPFDITALPRAELILPAEIAENSAAPLGGVLRLKTAMSNEVRATLVSDIPNRLSFPAELVIPAGSLEASFQFTALDNDVLTGPLRMRVSVQSSQIHASASLLLLDDEMPALTLNAPAELSENGSAQASILLDAPLSFDLEVQLRSDYTPVLEHPYSVTIPAGQTNVAFTVCSPDDPYFSDAKQATLRASVPGWPAAARSILIGDNEPKRLTLSTTAPRYPETFYQLAAFTISLGGVAANDIPLTIHSSDPTELPITTNAIIRAGSSSVALAFNLPGDDLKDGTQPVTLSVASPGFDPVSIDLEIADDDPATFEIGVTSATKFQGVPFTVGFQPIDINGEYINSFAGSAALSASNTTERVTLTPAETGPFAFWGATVEARIDLPGERFRIAAETNGALGVSPPFRLLPSPLFKTLSLAACDLRVTPDRANLVASASESDAIHPNRILIIDSTTTQIARTIPTRRLVGRDKPESFGVDGQLALNSDATSIFVIAENGTMVQQFAWQDGALLREFSLGTNEFGEIKLASTIQGVPGQPNQVAIGQVDSWNARSTRIYDQGAALPDAAPFGARMMLQPAPERSYFSAFSGLWSASLGPTGFADVQQFAPPSDYAFWDTGDVQLFDGLVHYTTGVVYDSTARRLAPPYPLHRSHYPRDLIGTFDFDTNRHRAFFITPRANGGQMLDLFDIPTRQTIRRIELGMIPGYVSRLYYLGDSLAAMDAAGIYFFRSSLFEPVGASVSVPLSRHLANAVATVAADFTYSLSITNEGTNAATEITVDEYLPDGIAFVSAQPNLGRWEKNERGLRWIVDDLPPGASGSLQIAIKPGYLGTFALDSSLATYEWNDSPSQLLRTSLQAQLAPAPNSYSYLPLGARSIAHDKTRGLIYASIGSGLSPFAEKIVEIDHASGRIVGSFEAGPLPYLIATSDDDQFLWVVADDRRNIRRYALPSKAKDLEFQLRTHPPTPTFSSPIYDTAVAIEPVPGQPRSLAILQLRIYEGTGTQGGGIAIYDDAALRPLVGLETPGEFVTASQILFDPAGTTVFGNAPWNQTVEIYSLSAEGVTLRQRLSSFQSLGHPGLAVSGAELVAGDAAVLSTSDFAFTGFITNSAGEKMIPAGAGAVTLHPGNRLSFVNFSKTYFADLSTRTQLGSIDLPLGQDYPIETLAIGDRLVFLINGGSIYFVRSEHLALPQPAPPALKANMLSGALILRAESRRGLKYQLQSSPLLPAVWMNQGEPKTATDSALDFTIAAPTAPQTFYRIKIE